jgi:uncharacterized protein YjbI with pentapeptide repeats
MERYALVIGIGQYDGMDDLSKPGGDAIAFQQVLKNAGWRVTCLNNRVTYDALEKALKTFLERQAAGQDALIYFTGHGFMVEESCYEQRGYLATSDCAIDSVGEKIVAQRKALSFSYLNGLIREARLSSLVVLLDCCHGGLFVEDMLVTQSFQASLDRNFCWIAACRSFQQAYARTSEPHSFFTGALLAGLAAAGEVTVMSVLKYVNEAFKQLAMQEPIYIGAGKDIPLISPEVEAPIVPTASQENPYQGLQAFTPATKQFFFGRDREIEALVQKVQQCGFVPVIGASGSGKSSIVRAGLIPRLEGLGWRILPVMKPGTEPMAMLRSVTPDLYVGDAIEPVASVKTRIPGNEKILLVVDQFEEVFTLERDKSEKTRFIKCLREFSAYEQGRIAVVVTMRTDFVEAGLAKGVLTQAMLSDAVWLGPMTGADLEAAIKNPAIVQGATLQPELFMKIVQDVEEEPNCLPLLEFALSELWVSKAESELTLAAYRKLGGVAGALNAHAEAIYKQLAAQKREHWVQRVMLRLVRTGEGTKDTRQRQRKSDLLDIGKDVGEQDAIESVIQTLVDGRLLVSDRVENQDVIDLSHEALMQSWQRLAGWRENDRDDRQIVDKIEDAQRKWREDKKRQNLLEGRLLKDGKRLLKKSPDAVVATKGFIRTSLLWRRLQIIPLLIIPLLVVGIESSWREELIKYDNDEVRKGSSRDKDYMRASVLNLAGGCWAVKQHEKVPVYLRERIFGNCRSLHKARLTNIDLGNTNLSGANLEQAELTGVNLRKANLSGANLEEANLSGSVIIDYGTNREQNRHTNLKEANLSGANLEQSNLSGTNLEYAVLSDADLREASLSGANLEHAVLSNANLQLSNMSSASLRMVNLSDADLGRVNLSGADLSGADLSSASLRMANLSSANLNGTNFTGVLFHCFSNGIELGNDRICPNLNDVRWDSKTNWQGVQNWQTVRNIPPALKQQLGLKDTKN